MTKSKELLEAVGITQVHDVEPQYAELMDRNKMGDEAYEAKVGEHMRNLIAEIGAMDPDNCECLVFACLKKNQHADIRLGGSSGVFPALIALLLDQLEKADEMMPEEDEDRKTRQ